MVGAAIKKVEQKRSPNGPTEKEWKELDEEAIAKLMGLT
jgi:hypothetical protein